MTSAFLFVVLAGGAPHVDRSARLFQIVQSSPHDLRLLSGNRNFVDPFPALALTSGDGISILTPEVGSFVFKRGYPAYILVGGVRRGTSFFAATVTRDGGRHWIGGGRVDLESDLTYCSSGLVGDELVVTFKRPGELVDFRSDDGGASWSSPTTSALAHRDGTDIVDGPCDEVMPTLDDRPYGK